MKQMRGLLIAAVALAVLSGLVYWSKKHKADEAGKPSPDAAPKILTLEEKHVSEIRVQKQGHEPMTLKKVADQWEITNPEPMRADQDTVASLISTASTLTSDRLIDDKPSDLQTFGLKEPFAQITLSMDNGKGGATLQLGKDTPAGGATYVKLANDPRVFTIATYSKNNLDKPLSELRDKRLLTFNTDKISRVDLDVKGHTIEFGKNGLGEWQILKPEPLRADALQVDDLVRKLKDAKIQVDPGKIAPATFAAVPKIATVSVTDNSGTQTAEIREDAKKTAYAKSSVVDGIYKVGADLVDVTNKQVTDFRSKKLFDFGFSELSEVTANGTTYTRSGEKWLAGGKEMDSGSIQALIEKLRDLTSIGFTTKAGGKPVFTAGATTQDKKHSEKITILREGDRTSATRDGEPAVYTLENSAADDLMKAAADVKPAAPKTPSPKKK